MKPFHHIEAPGEWEKILERSNDTPVLLFKHSTT